MEQMLAVSLAQSEREPFSFVVSLLEPASTYESLTISVLTTLENLRKRALSVDGSGWTLAVSF